MVANNRRVQRPRNDSGAAGSACSVLSLTGGAAALAPGCGTGLGCGAPVCCDSFLAGFVSARFRKLDFAECLRHALAAGAANTQRYGAGVLDAGLATGLLDSAEVEELSLRR